MTRLQIARQRVRVAEIEYEKAIKAVFPRESQQLYRHGKNLVQCIILGYAQDRIFVCGLMSGKDYWICASRFVE